MTCHRKRTEGAEIPTVLESDQAEWNDNEEDCLFVDVPSKKERGVSAKSNGAHEGCPLGAEPEFYQRKLER